MGEAARVIETDEERIATQALAIPDQAKMIHVTDALSMEAADKMKGVIQGMKKEIDIFFKPMADKAFQAHRAITSKWKETLAPLEEADKYITGEVKTYQRLERERAEAEERRIAEERRKAEEEKRLAEAAELEKQGHIEEASAIIEEPFYVEPVKVETNTVKVDQRKYRTIWRARIEDKNAFIIFIADMLKKVPELKKEGRHAEAGVYLDYAQALEVSQSWANKKAAAMGKELSIPGLKAYEE